MKIKNRKHVLITSSVTPPNKTIWTQNINIPFLPDVVKVTNAVYYDNNDGLPLRVMTNLIADQMAPLVILRNSLGGVSNAVTHLIDKPISGTYNFSIIDPLDDATPVVQSYFMMDLEFIEYEKDK